MLLRAGSLSFSFFVEGFFSGDLGLGMEGPAKVLVVFLAAGYLHTSPSFHDQKEDVRSPCLHPVSNYSA